MDKKTTQMIKGIAILIMIAHHFIVIPFSDLPYLVTLFGYACKICVAIYAVLSGYGYFFTKEKTIRYGLKKIWGLLQIYWISLFTLFIPTAVMGGWKITPWKLVVQMFGLSPNLNWFAWYIYFYIFCILIMPILCRCKVFRHKAYINFILIITVPYIFEVIMHIVPFYETNILVQDLATCFMYFPSFLIGYWLAENKIIEKSKRIWYMNNPVVCIVGIIMVFAIRIVIKTIAGFSLDVFYVPILICCIANLFEKVNCVLIKKGLSVFGKYSTQMWFFHAVFFSTYVCDWFQPILKVVSWPPLMFVWLVILSLVGAIIYEKILKGIRTVPQIIKRSL